MINTIPLQPGITLRCFRDNRFKQGRLSVQFVRPMCREEAAVNALIPAVLLRGCDTCPDLRDITRTLDDLYGASVGALVRRVGDYQTTGLYCSFIDDRYALKGDTVLAPMVAFLEQLLFHPVLEAGAFRKDFVESEKVNLISTIASELNDKRAYAAAQLLKIMCRKDSFGIPRLGETAEASAITPEGAYRHYQKVLKESRVDIFYVGSAPQEQVAELLKPLFDYPRSCVDLPEQTSFVPGETQEKEETLPVSQGKLGLGFTTSTTLRDSDFVPMQVFNTLFGGGMTSRLFQNIREKNSLCYDISSGYHSSKGILTVHAGIDCDKKDLVKQQVEQQLSACQQGDFTQSELTAAKEALLSSLESTHDSPGSIEAYYATAALSGLPNTPEAYMLRVQQVTPEQVQKAAQKLRLNTVYFLKGV